MKYFGKGKASTPTLTVPFYPLPLLMKISIDITFTHIFFTKGGEK
jgi:hypothetical protein